MNNRTLALAAVLAVGTTGCGYNTIQSYDEQAAQAKQNIEVQLQRRADLIPNLVETVKGFAKQEATVFTEVARAQAVLSGALTRSGGTSAREMAEANDGVSRALVPFFAFAQQYPQLKSDQQFLQLQDELRGTENRIGQARLDYNQSVQQYNTYIRKFPATLTARATGAKAREYFEVAPGAREVPKVDFGGGAGAAAPVGASSGSTTPAATDPARRQ